MAARFIVCVLLDSFITAVERQRRPDLQGRPLIVGGDPKQRGLVVAASAEAAAGGVTVGMPTWEALRLCPQAALLSPDLPHYHNSAQIVLGILSLYGDLVEHDQLDRFFLSMPGATADLLIGLQQDLVAQAGLSVSIGAASNKLVAYIAARIQAPNGRVLAPAGQEASFLQPLPVQWLATEKTEAQLRQLGVHTIGELARTPERLLTSHFGEEGKRLLRYAQGKDGRSLRPTQQRTAVEWEQAFDRAISDPEALRRWAVYLCSRVGQDMRSQGQRARTLTLTLGHLDDPPTVLTAVLPRASDLDRTLRDAVLRVLQAWDGRSGVASLGLEAGIFVGERDFQLQLFAGADDAREENERKLDKAKNGINKRYGHGAVMAAMLLDDDILEAMGRQRRKKAR